MKLLIQSLLAVALLAFAGCGTLDKSGVYQGDQFLFAADQTITTSYQALDTFLAWELNNRAALSANSDIKKEADYIRKNARQWYDSAFALRQAYIANPTPENKASLQNILNLIQTALTEATKYLSTQPTLPSA